MNENDSVNVRTTDVKIVSERPFEVFPAINLDLPSTTTRLEDDTDKLID